MPSFHRIDGIQLNAKSQDGSTSRVIKIGNDNCAGGNYTVVVHQSRAIFAHVDTPLLGYVWQKGGANIDIIPVLTEEHTIIGKNPHFSINSQKVSSGPAGNNGRRVYEFA
jgi:hypothetical protein